MVVTVSGLGVTILGLLGIALSAFGFLIWFAAGMATIPDQKPARKGGLTFLAGLAAIGISIAHFLS